MAQQIFMDDNMLFLGMTDSDWTENLSKKIVGLVAEHLQQDEPEFITDAMMAMMLACSSFFPTLIARIDDEHKPQDVAEATINTFDMLIDNEMEAIGST